MSSAAVSEGATLAGAAMLGKTAAALAFIVLLILVCSYLVKRLNMKRGLPGQRRLRVVSSVGVGQRERVVIVEVEDRWLVLGVGGGQVNKLHDLPAPPEPAEPRHVAPDTASEGFAARLGKAIGRQSSPETPRVPPKSHS